MNAKRQKAKKTQNLKKVIVLLERQFSTAHFYHFVTYKNQRFLTDWGASPSGRNFLIFPWVRNFILRPPIREESDSYTVYCAYHRLQINKNTHRHKKIGWKMTFQWNKYIPIDISITYVMKFLTLGIFYSSST